MEYLWSIFTTNLMAIMAMMFAVWLLSLIKRDASIVDVFWGLGFVVVAWLTFLQADGYLGRKVLITVLTTLWGLRLALYICIRNWGHGEDRRYQAWRSQYGARFRPTVRYCTSIISNAGRLPTPPGRPNPAAS